MIELPPEGEIYLAPNQGYIAMLSVDESHRGLGIGTKLVEQIIKRMRDVGCEEVGNACEVHCFLDRSRNRSIKSKCTESLRSSWIYCGGTFG